MNKKLKRTEIAQAAADWVTTGTDKRSCIVLMAEDEGDSNAYSASTIVIGHNDIHAYMLLHACREDPAIADVLRVVLATIDAKAGTETPTPHFTNTHQA